MNIKFILLFLILAGCGAQKSEEVHQDTTNIQGHLSEDSIEILGIDSTDQLQTYSNERFKDVTVERIDEYKFLIKGKGQIFESNFGWVIEDGHNEILKGYQTTDAGAPQWGNFKFTVEVRKERSNSTLHLILFETSAKDGTRAYELPIRLY